MRNLLFIIVFALALSSCKKYEDNDPMPNISDVPQISLVSVNPTTVQQLNDSVVFTIHYTDGNGDLGFESADSMSLELTDMRFPLTFGYHVQPLSPANSSLTIAGNLPVVLEDIILQDSNSTQETATFQIRIKDRAGNWSNTITTPGITVLP